MSELRDRAREVLTRFALGRICPLVEGDVRLTVLDDGCARHAMIAVLEEPDAAADCPVPAICFMAILAEKPEAVATTWLRREQAELLREAIDRVFPREGS